MRRFRIEGMLWRHRLFALLGLLGSLAACSPALNWRETRLAEAGGAVALFPCKPDRVARRISLADSQVEMAMVSCAADGVTFAIAYVELSDAARSAQAVVQLRDAAARNVPGPAHSLGPFKLAGMAPGVLAERVQIVGRRADGRPLAEQAVFAVKGLRVFQASVLGDSVDANAADTFFEGLKLAE